VITRMKQDHQILLSSEGPLHNVLKIKPPAAFSAADCDRFLHGLDQALAAG
jgi:4-aminobutyrate aminotransferase-like enzyme